MAEILWQSVQVRFNLHEEWHREMVFRKMNEDWRASKSTLVRKVRNASNEEERLKLQPDNIKSLQDWKDFVKEKTSEQFKVRSNKFKGMRQKQLELQHTMSRKGYARLTIELKKKNDVSSISRAVVWADGHTNKNGQPANKKIAQKIKDMERIERDKPNSSSTNLKEDALSQVLGPEKRGRLRTFGKGVTLTRLTILSQMNGQFDALREENVQLRSEMSCVKNTVEELKKSQVQSSATTEGTPTTPIVSPSIVNISPNTKCKLLDWMGTGDVVAEGRWSSSDPNETCHCVPIGPNAMKVWVDVAKKPEVFLWRPTSDLTYVVDAVGTTIAWPASQVIMDSSPGSIG
ncbi:uncharacterized protein LOC131301962 isoform X1 [Rhododendron vialii]|uniref:uncharacterized protein LOC131301962 isoform X1 n=1 Tax=Rhododendron vialii TaxID=182163 RepID=UPI00265EA4DE|nr:uncharacterized protein LOC131301962 isoform X1 [Rhododendron vialii]